MAHFALDPARSSAGLSASGSADGEGLVNPSGTSGLSKRPPRGAVGFSGSGFAGSYAARRVSAAISEADRAVRVVPRRFFRPPSGAGGDKAVSQAAFASHCPAWAEPNAAKEAVTRECASRRARRHTKGLIGRGPGGNVCQAEPT